MIVITAPCTQASLIDDHFGNGDIATGGGSDVNGGFSPVSNGVGGNGTASESGTVATITTATAASNNSGISSIKTFDATSISNIGFKVTWVIDSVTTPLEVNGLLLAVDSESALWGDGVYFRFDAGKASISAAGSGGITIKTLIDNSVTESELADGFEVTLTFNEAGVSMTSSGVDSLHANGSWTWDYLNGNQSFGYDEVFDADTHVSVWTQTSDATANTAVVDRITVVEKPFGIDDHFGNSDIARGGATDVNGGFSPVNNGVGGAGTASESGTVATITTATAANNNSGISSINTFDATSATNLGFKATWIIDSVTTPLEGNGLTLTMNSTSAMWSEGVYLVFHSDGAAHIKANGGGGIIDTWIDGAVTASELADGFEVSLTCNETGISMISSGADSLHASGSWTWDYLNGAQSFGYDEVFDADTHVGVWTQTGDATANTAVVDRITVVKILPPPAGTLIMIQ